MKELSIKTVVAIGIGAAIFFVLGRFVAIPSGVPNTNIAIQYSLLSLFALIYGPIAGALIGFVGHTLIDLSWGGSPWWSWIIASTVVGLVMGLLTRKINIEDGEFAGKSVFVFVIACLISNLLAWLGVAPALDVLLYAEPTDKILAQGLMATIINFTSSAVVGVILAMAYAKSRVKQGSLSADNDADETEEVTVKEVTEEKVEEEKVEEIEKTEE